MERRNKKTKSVGNGEGSLYFSEFSNCWIYQYYANGKRKTMKQKKNEGVREFKTRVTDIKSKLDTGTYIEKNYITVYQLAEEIIENKLKRNIIGEASYVRNKQTLKHLEDCSLGNSKIQNVTFNQIQDFIVTKINYSDSTINKIYNLLNAIFNEALKRDYIIKNPMLKVEKVHSKQEKKDIEAFTKEEQRKFVKALENEGIYKNIFTIALFSGMRMGEVLSLKKSDIDFNEGFIHIKRTLTKDLNDKTKLGKTYSSTRSVPITPLFETELKNAIDTMKLNIEQLIFLTDKHSLMNVSTLNIVFKRICVKAGLAVTTYSLKRGNKYINLKTSRYNQHMLIHTYATRMIEAGTPAEILKKLLGHNIDIYTTVFDDVLKSQTLQFSDYIQKII